ncbi:hypothetical protein ACLB2K_029242 [Fragaria x ananassa]
MRGNHFQLIPFGSGPRGCLGIQLGLVVVKLVLAQLLHCFNWELPDGLLPSELDMTEEFGLSVPRATICWLFLLIAFTNEATEKVEWTLGHVEQVDKLNIKKGTKAMTYDPGLHFEDPGLPLPAQPKSSGHGVVNHVKHARGPSDAGTSRILSLALIENTEDLLRAGLPLEAKLVAGNAKNSPDSDIFFSVDLLC